MRNGLVKVCGLTDPENIRELEALGIDLFGFIFYPPSPRCILGKTSANAIASLAPGKEKVGVFVNEIFENILKTAAAYGLTAIQLHGRETPEFCGELQPHFKVFKAFPIAESADFEACDSYDGVCDGFIFDTKGASHGGNGVAFDWDILTAYAGNTPFLLSGGIQPNDALKIRQIAHPQLAGVDLNSRFEDSPGMKNAALVAYFLENWK